MANGRLWTDAERELLRTYAKGNAKTLAAQMGRTATSVRSMAFLLGICAEPHWTDEEIAILRERYPMEGVKPLLGLLKRTKRSIHHAARNLGIKCPNKFYLQSRSKIENLKSVDIHFFDEWSADMAYILGYIWSDGCLNISSVNNLQFGCVSDDDEVIHFIRKVMKSTHKIGKHIPKTLPNCEPNRQQTYLAIPSKFIIETLVEKHGLDRNKSCANLPYPEVPDEWLHHFARGLLDGDGHVMDYCGNYHIEFIGSHNFIIGLQQQICRILGIRAMKIGESGKLRLLRWYRRDERLVLYRWLYPSGDGYFFFKRKREAIEKALKLNLE